METAHLLLSIMTIKVILIGKMLWLNPNPRTPATGIHLLVCKGSCWVSPVESPQNNRVVNQVGSRQVRRPVRRASPLVCPHAHLVSQQASQAVNRVGNRQVRPHARRASLRRRRLGGHRDDQPAPLCRGRAPCHQQNQRANLAESLQVNQLVFRRESQARSRPVYQAARLQLNPPHSQRVPPVSPLQSRQVTRQRSQLGCRVGSHRGHLLGSPRGNLPVFPRAPLVSRQGCRHAPQANRRLSPRDSRRGCLLGSRLLNRPRIHLGSPVHSLVDNQLGSLQVFQRALLDNPADSPVVNPAVSQVGSPLENPAVSHRRSPRVPLVSPVAYPLVPPVNPVGSPLENPAVSHRRSPRVPLVNHHQNHLVSLLANPPAHHLRNLLNFLRVSLPANPLVYRPVNPAGSQRKIQPVHLGSPLVCLHVPPGSPLPCRRASHQVSLRVSRQVNQRARLVSQVVPQPVPAANRQENLLLNHQGNLLLNHQATPPVRLASPRVFPPGRPSWNRICSP